MNSKKILTILVGIAVGASVILGGIIVGTGIKNRKNAFASSEIEKVTPYVLEKTSLDDFSEISISISYADISIIPSDGYYLEYRLDGTCKEPTYSVSDGKFHFEEGNVQEKYQVHFGLFPEGPFYLKLYVPEDKYFDLLSIYNDSGNVDFQQIQAKEAELTLDYGNLNFENFTGDTFHLTMDSGNLDFGTISCNDLTIKNEYGNVTGDSLTASTSGSIKLDSGNLETQQLTSSTFSLTNDYGNTDIYSFTSSNSTFSINSGNLSLEDADFETVDIRNEYGNVDLELRQDLTDFNYDLSTEYGDIHVDNKRMQPNDDEECTYKKDNGKDRDIEIFCDSGNINVTRK